MADHRIATYGMEGVTAERIRPPWDQLPSHSGRGAEADRRRFGAIAMLAFVRILLFLATAAGARQLPRKERLPLSATRLSRAAPREK